MKLDARCLAISCILVACGRVVPYALPAPNGAAGDEVDAGDDGGSAAIDAAISIDAPAAVLGCATAPEIPGTGTVTGWSQQTGNVVVDYFGDGNIGVDVTKFDSIWSPMDPSAPWPAHYDTNANIPLTINKYISAEFTVPVGYFATQPADVYGNISVGESGFSAAVSMTISEHCGDFGQLEPTTVVTDCMKNKLSADGILTWRPPGTPGCQLQEGHTYYLNVIDADISSFPATTTLRAQYCVNDTCTTPIIDGIGSWTNPTM